MANTFLFLTLFMNGPKGNQEFLSRNDLHKKYWDTYCIALDNLKFFDMDIITKSVLKNDRLDSSIGFFVEYSQNDMRNLNEIKKIHHIALKSINDNIESAYQFGMLFHNSTKDEQLDLLKKALKSGEYIRNACAGKKSLLPFFWYNNLRMLADGPFNQIDGVTQSKFLKDQILPFFDSLLMETGTRNAYIDECRIHCRCMIYIFDENFNFGYSEIEKLKKYRSNLDLEDDTLMILPTILRMSLLFKERRYKDVINDFKTLPPKWLDYDEKKTWSSMFIFIRMASDAYFETGNIEASKTWREVAISLNYSIDFKSNRDIALQDAIKLRDIYIKEKSWAMMRSLEERSAKFGMKALPKQVGEI